MHPTARSRPNTRTPQDRQRGLSPCKSQRTNHSYWHVKKRRHGGFPCRSVTSLVTGRMRTHFDDRRDVVYTANITLVISNDVVVLQRFASPFAVCTRENDRIIPDRQRALQSNASQCDVTVHGSEDANRNRTAKRARHTTDDDRLKISASNPPGRLARHFQNDAGPQTRYPPSHKEEHQLPEDRRLASSANGSALFFLSSLSHLWQTAI